jgi:hypothetical protein
MKNLIYSLLKCIYSNYKRSKFIILYPFFKINYTEITAPYNNKSLSDNKYPKVASFSMIKNEEDIIEHFIRINSLWCNHFFIFDDDSSDGTLSILNQLIIEGFNISIYKGYSKTYQQNFITTNFVRKIARLNNFDYIFPIDADEFIHDHEIFLNEINALPDGNIGMFTLTSLVPSRLNVIGSENAFFGNFKQRITESGVMNKVLLPNSISKTIYLEMGNHSCFYVVRNITFKKLASKLMHVPIRSDLQLTIKILIGSYKFHLKKNKSFREGRHWILLSKKIRSASYVVNISDLRKFSYDYISNFTINDQVNESNLIDYHFIKPYPLKYQHLIVGNAIPVLDSFIMSHLNI